MTPLEMVGRINDLETALRIVVFIWIATIVLLNNMPDCQCHPRHVCPTEDDVICPLHKVARNRCDRYHKE
jgi:hypothetical protein